MLRDATKLPQPPRWLIIGIVLVLGGIGAWVGNKESKPASGPETQTPAITPSEATTDASGDPIPPTTVEELTSRPNDNAVLSKFLATPFATVTPEGQRVILYFDGGDFGSPFMKAGTNAGSCSLGAECMIGVVKTTRFRWSAYRWQSRRDMMLLCLRLEGGSTFDCFQTRTGRTRTAPEQYSILEFNNQVELHPV